MYVTTKEGVKVIRIDTLETIMEFPRVKDLILFALAENRIYQGLSRR